MPEVLKVLAEVNAYLYFKEQEFFDRNSKYAMVLKMNVNKVLREENKKKGKAK